MNSTRQQERDEAAPRTAHEWLEDALGRYQVTHIHASIREALKAMNKTEVDTSELPAPVQPEDETTLPALWPNNKDIGDGFKWEKKATKEDVAQLYADHKQRETQLKTVLSRELATTAKLRARIEDLEAAHTKEVMLHAVTKFERDALKAQLTSAQTLYNMCSAKRLEYKTELSTLKAQLDTLKAELNGIGVEQYYAMKVRAEAAEAKLRPQLDAVVGQETGRKAWKRAFDYVEEHGWNHDLDKRPPYTPPLKAGR
jgi:hypothetical protein